MNFIVKKIISGILIGGQLTLMFHNINAYAVTPQQLGNSDAYMFSKQLQNDLNNTAVSPGSGGVIVFGNKKVQNAMSNTGGTLQKNDLTPATSGKIDNGRTYVSRSAPSIEELQAVYSQDDEVITIFANEKLKNMDTELANEAEHKSSATIESEAYSTIQQVAGASKPDLSNDPMLKRADSMLSSTSGNPFADCSIEKKLLTSQKTVHEPLLQNCTEAPVVTSEQHGCKLLHDFNVVILNTIGSTGAASNSLTADYCTDSNGNTIENCTSYIVGDKNTTNQSVALCTTNAVNTMSKTFAISNADAIKKATLYSVTFSGTVRGWSKGSVDVAEDRVYFSYSAPCGSLVKDHFVLKDVTDVIKKDKANLFTLNLDYTGAVPYVTLRVEYDPTKVVANDAWGEDSCVVYADRVASGELSGTLRCTSELTSTPFMGKESIRQNGITLPVEYLRPVGNLKGNCVEAEVTVTQSNFKADGDLQSCEVYKNKGCSFNGTKCAKYNALNNCVLESSVYDCGKDTVVENNYNADSYDCPGGISCIGKDCTNILVKNDATKDWAKALGLMQMSQSGISDVMCTYNGENNLENADGNSSLTEQGSVQCYLWGGKADECNMHNVLSIKNDCCHEPGSTANVADFVKQVANLWKINGIVESVKMHSFSQLSTEFVIGNWNTTTIYGTGWDFFKSMTPMGQSFQKFEDKLTNPIVNGLNNIIPYAGEVFKGLTGYAETQIVNALGEWVTSELKDIMSKIIGQVVTELSNTGIGSALGIGANSAASSGVASAEAHVVWGQGSTAITGTGTTAGGAAAGLASTIGAVISFIGWVYAIYSIAKMAIQLMTKCKESEYELQQEIQLQKCDLVGRYCAKKVLGTCIRHTQSYCCFDSPLSRILNKQVRYALNGCPNHYPAEVPSCAFALNGNVETPICYGITLEQLAQADWNKIDLTEWLQLLEISGALDGNGMSVTSSQYLPFGGYDNNGNYHDLNNQTQKQFVQYQ